MAISAWLTHLIRIQWGFRNTRKEKENIGKLKCIYIYTHILIYIYIYIHIHANNKNVGLPQWLNSKESACNAGDAGDAGWNPGLGRSPGEENDNLFQYPCLEKKIPWTEESGRLQSMGSQRVGYDSYYKCIHFIYKGPYINIYRHLHVFLPHLLKEMIAFTEDKNKHKYKPRETENKFAKTLQCTYFSTNNM